MNVQRLLDIWQVVLQEPRVALKEELLIMRAEEQQAKLAAKLDKENYKKQTTIEKANKAEHEKISKENTRNNAKQNLLKQKNQKNKKNSSKIKRNSLSDGHLDLMV